MLSRLGREKRKELSSLTGSYYLSAMLSRQKGNRFFFVVLECFFSWSSTQNAPAAEIQLHLRPMLKISLFHCSAWWLLSICSLRFYSHNFTFIFLGPFSSNPCIDLILLEVLGVVDICNAIQLLLLPMQSSDLLFTW